VSVALLAGAFPASGQDAWSAANDYAVLDATIDALPDIIDRVWGFEEDLPYTVVLRSIRLAPATIDSRDGVGHGFLDNVEHPIAWLEAQLEKSHVLQVCWAAGLYGCERGESTMVLTLAHPEETRTGATIQVALNRRLGGPPNRQGGFYAQLLITLVLSNGVWSVTDLRVLGIT
jgi:hypothetical protein